MEVNFRTRKAEEAARRLQWKQSPKVQAEPFECGWCYQPIYRVWQKNGYYRYYEAKALTEKHICTRPAWWDPDKG